MMDLNHFRQVNDRFGHQIGDEILAKFGMLLSELEEEILSCRIGGDEFWVLMRNIQSVEAVKQKAQELCERIMMMCNGYQEIALSGSIGISFFPQDGTTLEDLYAKADEALYEAKRNGKSQFVLSQSDFC